MTHNGSDATDLVMQFLSTAPEDDLLQRVQLAAALRQEVDVQQRAVVSVAQERHSWAEIGAALGVSKQAAHRRFVTLLADDMKAQAARAKQARRAGRSAEAAAGRAAVVESAENLRRVRHIL